MRGGSALFVLAAIGVLRCGKAVVLPLGLAACGQALPHPPYSPQATGALEAIDSAPPPGRIELIPPRPPQADAWIDGEWIPMRGRWYWLLGRWVKTPSGATYSPWVVVRTSDGTPLYAPSVWKDARGTRISPPPALAIAASRAQVVFDAEGELVPTGANVESVPSAAEAAVPRPAQPVAMEHGPRQFVSLAGGGSSERRQSPLRRWPGVPEQREDRSVGSGK